MTTNNWLNRCHFGDVRAVLRRMAADGVKVQTIVTSPPYWGLRSYLPAGHVDKVHEIGSEPTLREFIDGLVEVFDLCRDVLADDGTMWVNMGDSYAGSWGGQSRNGESPQSMSVGQIRAAPKQTGTGSLSKVGGLKAKDLMGQPWRLAFALQDAGWYLRQDIIWKKPNPMPESIRDRCTKAHEYIFLLAKSEKYYYDFEAMQEPVEGGAHARRAGPNAMRGQGSNRPEGGGRANREGRDMATVGQKVHAGWATGAGKHTAMEHQTAENHRKLGGTGVGWGYADNAPKPRVKNNASFDEAMAVMPSTRNRRSVWTVPSEPYSGAHFATFPRALIEPCVLAGAAAGGIVLDPFFGSGTTGQVAQQLGRQFIGIELNEANEPLQRERLRQPSLMLEAAA